MTIFYDDFLGREKRTDNGNRDRRSFEYGTHDNTVSAFAQEVTFIL
jgi:hypothetical protein